MHIQFVQSGPEWLALLLEVIPSFALFRGLWEMSQYAFLASINNGTGACVQSLRIGCNSPICAHSS